jgi:CheY-like chemotaxis protein
MKNNNAKGKRVKRVLIVDDNRDVRQILRQFLERDGCVVWSAGSGEEAIGILRRCEPEVVIPVVVSDISLPGMDGLTLCRKLKKKEPLKIMIAVTGRADCFSIAECRDAGFDDYMAKPIDKAMFSAMIENAFKRFFYWERMLYYDKSNRSWNKERRGGFRLL